MSDSYQPIYDAVRSRIHNGDIGAAAESAMRNIGDYALQAFQQIPWSFHGYERPSAIYRPKLTKDGSLYCALYGENLAEGCAGFGESPDLAMQDFDKNWIKKEEQK